MVITVSTSCSAASSSQTLCDPCSIAHQAPLSVGFPRQEYWSGLSSPGDLPSPGIEPPSPLSPALQAASLPLSHWGSPTVVDVEAKNGSDLPWDIRDLRLHPCNSTAHLEIFSFFNNFSMFSMENDGQVIRGHSDKYSRNGLPKGLSLK